MSIIVTDFEGSVTASMFYSPELGDISEASEVLFDAGAHGDAALSTVSAGWALTGTKARLRQQTNPVGGATVKGVVYVFQADDPATADPLVIDSNINSNFGGHLVLIS